MPNTKIIIQERDETSPRGSGVSSDIAYVPGLAIDKYKIGEDAKTKQPIYQNTVKNKPVLCYTVADFEAAFGPTPYVYTQDDILGAGTYETTCEKNGFDRSYIYAKELLQAGLPLYYENIAPDDNSVLNVTSISSVEESINGQFSPITEDSDIKFAGGNTYTYIACQDRTGVTEQFKFYFRLPVPPASSTSSDNTLSGGTVCVKLITPEGLDPEVLTIACKSLETGSSKFTIAGEGDTYTITWGKVSASAFDTDFTLNVDFTYKGKDYAVEYPVTIAIVEGVAVTGEVTNGRINYFYTHLADALLNLEDKNEYTVKYITSGGYPTFDIGPSTLYTTMLSVAGNRGDAVALIDHLDRPEASHGTGDLAEDSIFNKVNRQLASDDNAEYGAMFTPWGKYAFATITDNPDAPAFMPASYGYLMCMAAAIATSPNWLAMAGVTRGAVPNLQELHTDKILSNVVAEDYQPKYGTGKNVSINCITNIKPYGLCIWGNRTLQPMPEKGAVALNFLNTRNMVSDIKKVAYSTAKALMFEQDSEILWLRFKSGISPLLDQLKSGYGISNYKIIRGTTKYTGSALTRGELAAVIKIYPVAPIEYFEITVVLADEDVQVS